MLKNGGLGNGTKIDTDKKTWGYLEWIMRKWMY
jgi:hypothetical protein